MALRGFSILSATLSILVSTLAAELVIPPYSDFGVRMIANDGILTSHKNCSLEDHTLVQEAIFNTVTIATPTRRDLRFSKRRKLPNCADLCDGHSFSYCWGIGGCQSYTSNSCTVAGGCNRKLMMERTNMLVVLDEMFENGLSNDRKLVESFGITEEKCNEYKAKLYQAVLSQLDDIATECANLLLAPARLQCVVVVPAPSPALSTVPSGSPSQSPVV